MRVPIIALIGAALVADEPAGELPGPVAAAGPAGVNVLGLLIELFGESRGDPVTISITAFRGQGLLGDLLCSMASTPLPTP